MTQTKLTTEQIGKLKQARNGIACGMPWLAIDEAKDFWQHALNGLDAKIKHGTSDGKPWAEPDPPLTDQDACVWPRRLVMVRDGKHERWEGPFQYVGKDTASDCSLKYLVWGTDGYHEWYEQARPATPEEIEAAK